LRALSAEDGKTLWERPCGKWGPGAKPDLFVIGDTAYVHGSKEMNVAGFDVRTGAEKRRFSSRDALHQRHHHRCYRNKATERFILTGRQGIEFIDLEREKSLRHNWVRGVCRYGILPCNGLLYVPPHACNCYIEDKINGLNALAPGGEEDPRLTEEAALRGPAFGSVPEGVEAAVDDWPTFRADIGRSGGTLSAAGAEMDTLWSAPVGKRPTACTVAAGKVFVASQAEHRVAAFDAGDGRWLWDRTVGAPVDSPPTCYRGLLLFGAHDGNLYCLRAEDGKLVWRRRVARGERRVVAFGRVESSWPAHGTVLVVNGVAYAAAGRSTHLDGGIRICALEPRTGRLLKERMLSSARDATGKRTMGILDVLTSDGNSVFMRHLAFKSAKASDALASDAAGRSWRAQKKSNSAGAGRVVSTSTLLDDTWFSRVGWTVTGMDFGWHDLAVFNDQVACGVKAAKRRGLGKGHYGQTPGDGYTLTGCPRADRDAKKWSVRVAIRAIAMALTRDILFVAGTPDARCPEDPWAALDGRKGGVLRAVSARTGEKLGERRLPAPPVYDGMAVANSRVYLVLSDGRVLCLGKVGTPP
jgi:outer membrane protein assembly factor BamB